MGQTAFSSGNEASSVKRGVLGYLRGLGGVGGVGIFFFFSDGMI